MVGGKKLAKFCEHTSLEKLRITCERDWRWQRFGHPHILIWITWLTDVTYPGQFVGPFDFFSSRFHVRCVAQAVDSVTRTDGTPLRSNVVTIATDSGICHNPVVSGSPWNLQAQSFVANLRYVPPDSIHHPNTLHVSVSNASADCGHLYFITVGVKHGLFSGLRSDERRVTF